MACIAYLHYPESLCTVSYIHQSQVQRDHFNCLSASHLVLAGGLGSQIQMAELGGGEGSEGGVGGGGDKRQRTEYWTQKLVRVAFA